MLIGSTGAWAQSKTAYAVLTDELDAEGKPGTDGKKETLTFKYGDFTPDNTTSWDVSNTGSSTPGWYSQSYNITHVVFDPSFADARPKSCYSWFEQCFFLTNIKDIRYLNTSEVINMGRMFYQCQRLTNLNLTHFDTNKVTNMENMFYSCFILTDLGIGSGFTVGSGTTTTDMFGDDLELATGTLYVKGTSAPSIAQDIFGVFTNGTLVTTLSQTDLGYTGPNANGKYTWKGGKFGSVGSKTAYAVLMDNTDGDGTKTLTFKYGEPMLSDTNEWNVTKTGEIPGWGYYDSYYWNYITKVEFDPSFAEARPKSCYYWFSQCENLAQITGIEYLNTSEVSSMNHMFSCCYSLTSLDLSHFDTSQVTDMNDMFWSCKNLTSLNLSNFDTGNVTVMGRMFCYCGNLLSLDISNFNTEKVTEMAAMFSGCSSMTSLDLSIFNTSKVTSMASMFNNCSSLTSLSIGSGFTVGSGTNTTYMFDGCTNLATGTLRVRGAAPDIQKNIFSGVYTSGTLISDVDLSSNWKGGNFTTTTRMAAYAVLTDNDEGKKTLTFKYGEHTLGANEWDVTNTGGTYGYDNPEWYNSGDYNNITQVAFDESFADARPKSCYRWFYDCTNLTTIEGIEYLNTSEVTSMEKMFCYCEKLTSLDLSHFNTSLVTKMVSMFVSCKNLQSLDLSNFDTSKVTDMSAMFYNCQSLTSLDVSHFDTREVTEMSQMFNGCSKLTSLDLSSFNTDKVTVMYGMFYECWKLERLTIGGGFTIHDVGDGYTPGTTDTRNMFQYCRNLSTGLLYINGTTAPSIEQDIFGTTTGITTGVFTNGMLFTEIPAATLGATQTGDNYTWKGGTFNTFGPATTYAVLSCGTLTFKYGVHTLSGTNEWDVSNTNGSQPWGSDITNVIFDPSFINARPVSCKAWFQNCNRLTSIDFTNLNTSEVTDMSNMFNGCSSLTSLDLSHFDIGKVESMQGMFNGCSSLTDLDLSLLNTDKVTNMSNLFNGCSNLRSLCIGMDFKVGAETLTTGMFSGCDALANGMLLIKDTSIPSIAHDIFTVYTNGTLITKADLGITESEGHYTWKGGTFNTYGPGTAYAVLTGEGNNKTLTFKYGVHTVSGNNEWDVTNTGTDYWGAHGWFVSNNNHNSQISHVVFEPSFIYARPHSCYEWFREGTNLTSITGLEYLNTSEVISMENMFYWCDELTSLDVSHFDTHNVTTMEGMFWVCQGLTYLDVSNFDTRNVIEMSYMFSNCFNLKSIDVSNFNTSNVRSMHAMFEDCRNLTSVDISSFNTSQVYLGNISDMFRNCQRLRSITIGSEFEIKSGYNASGMFAGLNQLANGTLYVKGATVPNIEQDIFGAFTSASLVTELTKGDFGISETSNPYHWKGGTFRSVGKVSVDYLDENGNETADAMPITTSVSSLDAGWYFVEGNVLINNKVLLNDNVHLILCDGATLTVNEDIYAGISGNYNLTIYGQTNGTGKLIVHSTSDKAIDCKAFKLYGGNLETGCTYGIYSATDVVIDGGVVTATGTDYGIYGVDNVTISGGKVTATGATTGIYAVGDITLGWTTLNDFIQASSYSGTVKTSAGKPLAYTDDGGTTTVLGNADTDYIFGSGTNATLDDIAGKTLRPAEYITTGGVTYLGMCRYDSDWKLSAGVKAYVVTGYDTATGTVTLSEAPLTGLPKGVPVILIKDTDDNGVPDGKLDPTFNLISTTDTEAAGIEGSVIGKDASPLFTAGDGTKTMAEMITAATGSGNTSGYMAFILEDGVFKMVAFSDTSVPSAGTCFLFVSKFDVLLMIRNSVTPPASNARAIPFDLGGDTTEVKEVREVNGVKEGENGVKEGDWYTLDGKKLDIKPTMKGIYINGNRKVVIK